MIGPNKGVNYSFLSWNKNRECGMCETKLGQNCGTWKDCEIIIIIIIKVSS